jgi:hypothetical protein
MTIRRCRPEDKGRLRHFDKWREYEMQFPPDPAAPDRSRRRASSAAGGGVKIL